MYDTLMYRGYYKNNDGTGYYLKSRYYWNTYCRFISPDIPDIAQQSKDEINGLNLFAYCNNDPVNNVDPDGKKAVVISDKRKIVDLFNDYKKSNIVATKIGSYLGSIIIKLEKRYFYMIVEKALKINEKITLSLLTSYAESEFKKIFKRDIIFSSNTINNEIKQHIFGYLYSRGFNYTCPTAFFLYSVKEKKLSVSKRKELIRDRCGNIDISENDVYDWRQRDCFHYFDGIRQKYQYKTSDPYYDSVKHIRYRTYKNKKWGSYEIN